MLGDAAGSTIGQIPEQQAPVTPSLGFGPQDTFLRRSSLAAFGKLPTINPSEQTADISTQPIAPIQGINIPQTKPLLGFSALQTPDDIGRVMNSIGHFESGGNYKAMGPATSTGDRAYGKYQVMGNNIPQWSKEAIGRSVTPQEYLANPAIQDAVARYKMGNYYKKYGNVGDVASVWFSGRPMQGNNAKDVIGTSVPKYVSNVVAIYNRLGERGTRTNDSRRSTYQGQPQMSQTPMQKYGNIAGQMLQSLGRMTTAYNGSTKFESKHPGIDIANANGTPIKAFTPGVVVKVESGKKQGDKGYGNSIIVKDPYGNLHRYSHLRDEWVKVGQKISSGQPIASMGNSGSTYSPSGKSDGTHLDYRVSNAYGKFANPIDYLNKFYAG